ncbi:hypothetical protein ACFL6N_00535, partial [Thermodesulfobacteriota bacterium]
MRPATILFLILLLFALLDATLYVHAGFRQEKYQATLPIIHIAVSGLGLTDLCVATEARYTRHP